ncbi:hypothetical protein BDF20DRAFT_821762 [Mycotypha africana]|uniref:uncharacterized protein n=1 Tax=Mycotypha africana TaxID=64632 RepID=UPI0022FFE6B6|nr:uncharacterized protein BDF20DRAFT_821762 [Mycotypha africana]KAI8977604.1 hypothetical protein BDF20DRAFT_821762 [Mycotypha africana]
MTGLLLMPSFQKDMDITSEMINSILISTLMAGAFIGAIFSGPLADMIGRKALMGLGTIIFILGNVLQVDQSEIAPKDMRGRLMSTQQFTITLGTCVSYWFDYMFVKMPESTGWRLAVGLQLIPAVFCLFGLTVFLPESPRHSIDKHRFDEALTTLSKIRGDGKTDDTDVLMEFTEMKQNISFEQRMYKHNKYKRIFAKGAENNRKRLWIGMAVQIFQQLTGVNALLVFAPQIFQSTGLKGRDAALFANGLSGSINLLAAIPAMIFVDRWGRRKTMIAGALLLSVCNGSLAILSAAHGFTYNASTSVLHEEMPSANTGKTSNPIFLIFDANGSTIGFLFLIYVCVAVYSCTWGTLGWIYPAELYSQGVRAKALGISTASNWLFTYVVLQLTPIMLKSIYWRTFVLFCASCLIIAFVVHWQFPETNGKSLEEVDLIFSGKFRFYDVDVHHPQTAAAALKLMEEAQQRNRNMYRFPFTPERSLLNYNHQSRRTLLPNYVVTPPSFRQF